MKHWIACLSVASLLWTTGCDTVMHSQLQIQVPRGEEKTRLTVPASERETVATILKEIATEKHFEDRTKLSLVPDTICSYAQPDVKYPISMRAWVSNQHIIIDLVQAPPDAAGESIAYRNLREELTDELQKQFGPRVTLVNRNKQAESKIVTPAASVSPAPGK
jgi:hypothetical protein